MRIGNKNFMNIQEAVGWLLENNALPFQSTANYAGNTEIAMSTLINPSPAKVRVGSLIFFADSKVSTVVGVTSNSFIVSDQYNDLVDDVVYVSNVALNASGHLIVTLSNGDTIDAGLIKQVTGFSINGSQHLIVTYNDGTSTDLGAIFSGNITISGNLTVTGNISGNDISGNSIIENMSGYSFTNINTDPNAVIEYVFASAVKTGNKLTFVIACNITKTGALQDNDIKIGRFDIPASVGAKLFPTQIGVYNFLAMKQEQAFYNQSTFVDTVCFTEKVSNGIIYNKARANLFAENVKYYLRYEITFLLSDNLAS